MNFINTGMNRLGQGKGISYSDRNKTKAKDEDNTNVENQAFTKEVETPSANNSSPKDDLYKAYFDMYQKDIEQSNVGVGTNEIGHVSQRSFDNKNKIITNETEAKEHLQDFMEKLIAELKDAGKYDDNMQAAIKFVSENFKWDLYFEKYPANNANKLELIYLQSLASAASEPGTSLSTIFLSGEDFKNYHGE